MVLQFWAVWTLGNVRGKVFNCAKVSYFWGEFFHMFMCKTNYKLEFLYIVVFWILDLNCVCFFLSQNRLKFWIWFRNLLIRPNNNLIISIRTWQGIAFFWIFFGAYCITILKALSLAKEIGCYTLVGFCILYASLHDFMAIFHQIWWMPKLPNTICYG